MCVVFVHRSIESLPLSYLILFKSKLNVFRVAAAEPTGGRAALQPDLDILGKRKGGRVDLHSSLVEPILRRFSHGVVSETSQISAPSTIAEHTQPNSIV